MRANGFVRERDNSPHTVNEQIPAVSRRPCCEIAAHHYKLFHYNYLRRV